MKINILTQPDDTTCGPTSLQAVYDYLNYPIELEQLIKEINVLENGGTLAVFLGQDALHRGFDAKIYSYNLRVFDPTWAGLDSKELTKKLRKQLKYKKGKKFKEASQAYIKFLKSGGQIAFDILTPKLLKKYLKAEQPILVGLSATYLYQSKREHEVGLLSYYDDLKGTPMGHFVVLTGLTEDGKVEIADPYIGNPFSQNNHYEVDVNQLINSIHLGIVTYDAALLVITPRKTEPHV